MACLSTKPKPKPKPKQRKQRAVAKSHLAYKDCIKRISKLTVTQGPSIGEPFQLFEWEDLALRGLLHPANKVIVVSIPRSNGKTTFESIIMDLGFHDYLSAFERGGISFIAPTLSQAGRSFEHFFNLDQSINYENQSHYKYSLSHLKQSIECKKRGAKMVGRSGNAPRNLHGGADSLILIDEPSQITPSRSDECWQVLRTGAGKVNGKILVVGTISPNPSHFFNRLVDGEADFVIHHGAGLKDDIFSEKTWRKANPTWDYSPLLRAEIKRAAEDASKNPHSRAGFEHLHLNKPVEPTATEKLISLVDYRLKVQSAKEIEPEGEYVLGLDMGGTVSQSGIAIYYPKTGALLTYGFWGSEPSLLDRGQNDRTGNAYLEMHRRGEIILHEGRTVDFALLLEWVVNKFGHPSLAVADRWKQGELVDAGAKAGLCCPFEWRGQGFKDSTLDIRNFRRACYEGKIKSKRNLLFEHGLRSALIERDHASNSRLTKKNQDCKIDIIAAAILAVGRGYLQDVGESTQVSIIR